MPWAFIHRLFRSGVIDGSTDPASEEATASEEKTVA
jgi:hypothetical protein